jgi:hypothetical protein
MGSWGGCRGQRAKTGAVIDQEPFAICNRDLSCQQPEAAGGVKMDQLLRQKRTSFERRKWGKEGGDDEAGAKGPRMRWGPKQLINGPPDMRCVVE